MLVLIILAEAIVFLLGVATGIFFRNQISAGIKSVLNWGRKKADDVEKELF